MAEFCLGLGSASLPSSGVRLILGGWTLCLGLGFAVFGDRFFTGRLGDELMSSLTVFG